MARIDHGLVRTEADVDAIKAWREATGIRCYCVMDWHLGTEWMIPDKNEHLLFILKWGTSEK